MQLVFEKSTSTVWVFATANELLEIAAIAQQRITEARLGESLTIFEEDVIAQERITESQLMESLTVFEKSVNQSNLLLRISVTKDLSVDSK